MTVIAWDGNTLAADKRASASGMIFRVTKIKKINGCLVGGSGDLSAVRAMFGWYENGADPSNLPDCQKDKDRWTPLLIITPDKKIFRCEQDGIPFEIEEPFFAIGSGREFAIAAMAMGGDSIKAVELASRFDTGCGDGIDILGFE
jgi:20S proteasome alpha/beta subunit